MRDHCRLGYGSKVTTDFGGIEVPHNGGRPVRVPEVATATALGPLRVRGPRPREVVTLRGCRSDALLSEVLAEPDISSRSLGEVRVEVWDDDRPVQWWTLLDAVVVAHQPHSADPERYDIVLGAGVTKEESCFEPPARPRFELFAGTTVAEARAGWCTAVDGLFEARVDPAPVPMEPIGRRRRPRPVWHHWYQGPPKEPNLWAPYDTQGRAEWLDLTTRAWWVPAPRPDRSGGEHHLDGRFVTDVSGLHCAMAEALLGPGRYFARGWDAFRDCLCGGFGVAPPFTPTWHDSEVARRALAEAVDEPQGRLSCFEEIVQRVGSVVPSAGATALHVCSLRCQSSAQHAVFSPPGPGGPGGGATGEARGSATTFRLAIARIGRLLARPAGG